MAIHIVATLISFSHPWRAYIPWAVAAVSLLWLRIWLAGRKCTWEREWRQRRVIVVGPPTPQVLSLLDHLTSLNCKTLYLPPSLPPNLLTLLHAIQLRSSITPTTESFLPSKPEEDEDPSAPEGKPERDGLSSRGEGEKLLSAEAMDPRKEQDMLAFVRLWAKVEGGGGDTGAGGRKVDAVVWAYGVGSVQDQTLLSGSLDEEEEVTASSSSSQEPGRYLTPEEDEHSRFLFFTLFLPQILNSTKTSTRSIRLVTLIHPIFPAGFATSPILHPPPTPITATTTPIPSPSHALRESYHAVRSIIFSSHLQRILDALAAKSDGEAIVEDGGLPEGTDESFLPKEEGEGLKEEKKVAVESEKEKKLAEEILKKKRRSNVLAVSVAPGWHTSSVLQPFLSTQWNQNPLFSLFWSATSPLRMLVAPSSFQTIQSILFSLSAPPGIVGWGGVVKDCGRAGVPAALLEDEALGRKVWEEMEAKLVKLQAAESKSEDAGVSE